MPVQLKQHSDRYPQAGHNARKPAWGYFSIAEQLKRHQKLQLKHHKKIRD